MRGLRGKQTFRRTEKGGQWTFTIHIAMLITRALEKIVQHHRPWKTGAFALASLMMLGASIEARAEEALVAERWGNIRQSLSPPGFGGQNIELFEAPDGPNVRWFARQTAIEWIEPGKLGTAPRWIDSERCPALIEVLQATNELSRPPREPDPSIVDGGSLSVRTKSRFPGLAGEGLSIEGNWGGQVDLWMKAQLSSLSKCWTIQKPSGVLFPAEG